MCVRVANARLKGWAAMAMTFGILGRDASGLTLEHQRELLSASAIQVEPEPRVAIYSIRLIAMAVDRTLSVVQ